MKSEFSFNRFLIVYYNIQAITQKIQMPTDNFIPKRQVQNDFICYHLIFIQLWQMRNKPLDIICVRGSEVYVYICVRVNNVISKNNDIYRLLTLFT